MSMKKIVLATAIAMGSMSAAMAANCSATVEANDQMQFNTKEITISKACPKFELELKHTGTMPKSGMGHNIVISKTADEQGVVTDGMAAGEPSNYVKADDARVLAHTKLIGGGESDKISIDTAKFEKGGDYSFFCTFPGHIAMMKGAVKVTD